MNSSTVQSWFICFVLPKIYKYIEVSIKKCLLIPLYVQKTINFGYKFHFYELRRGFHGSSISIEIENNTRGRLGYGGWGG